MTCKQSLKQLWLCMYCGVYKVYKPSGAQQHRHCTCTLQPWAFRFIKFVDSAMHVYNYYLLYLMSTQCWKKVFITGHAKLDPQHYVNKYLDSHITSISLFYQVQHNVINLTEKITPPLCLLLRFLHNRVPCECNNKLSMWVANNLIPYHMLLQLNMISLTSPKITLAVLFITQLLAFVKNAILLLP